MGERRYYTCDINPIGYCDQAPKSFCGQVAPRESLATLTPNFLRILCPHVQKKFDEIVGEFAKDKGPRQRLYIERHGTGAELVHDKFLDKREIIAQVEKGEKITQGIKRAT